MVGFNHAVFGGDCAAFNQGQQIALYTFTRDIGTATAFTAAADFVYLIEKNNAILLGGLYSTGFNFSSLTSLPASSSFNCFMASATVTLRVEVLPLPMDC